MNQRIVFTIEPYPSAGLIRLLSIINSAKPVSLDRDLNNKLFKIEIKYDEDEYESYLINTLNRKPYPDIIAYVYQVDNNNNVSENSCYMLTDLVNHGFNMDDIGNVTIIFEFLTCAESTDITKKCIEAESLKKFGKTVLNLSNNYNKYELSQKIDAFKINESCEIITKSDFCVSISHVDHERISKAEYYLKIAESVSLRGTCLRRKFGAIIVKDDRIVSTGYVGAPRGRINCCDRNVCYRMENNIPSGQRYELCRSVHAEMNAIIQASPEEMNDATLYLVGIENDGKYTNADCCSMCKRAIINSGISTVVARQSDGSFKTINIEEWINNDDSLDINHKGY